MISATASEEPLFDPLPLAELRRRCGSDVARDLVDLFRQSCVATAADLRSPASMTVARRHAHRLKGAAGLIGFRRLVAACTAIETATDPRASIAQVNDEIDFALAVLATSVASDT